MSRLDRRGYTSLGTASATKDTRLCHVGVGGEVAIQPVHVDGTVHGCQCLFHHLEYDENDEETY